MHFSVGTHHEYYAYGSESCSPSHLKRILIPNIMTLQWKKGKHVIELGAGCGVAGFVSDVIVCSGKYSVDYTKFGLNCDELFRINCRVRQSGGPIINWEGDVLGVAFNAKDFTAFLPTNIFLKWWKHVKTYREICRPFLGIEVANLFTKHRLLGASKI
ncbi:hypothetical protein Leryth_009523 [Lithospermum erythrorhizon]|nr:hypothetical protein Leryth_009523 [Lithospermum erythrorhizon]